MARILVPDIGISSWVLPHRSLTMRNELDWLREGDMVRVRLR